MIGDALNIYSRIQKLVPAGQILYAGTRSNLQCCRIVPENRFLVRFKIFPTQDENQLAVAAVLLLPWGPTPSAEAYNNQDTYYATGLSH